VSEALPEGAARDETTHLATRLKRARRAVVSGGSHAFAEEQPEEVAAAIRQHLSPER
jgi:pimeloyl-ACP methyl ester carboxylesterase